MNKGYSEKVNQMEWFERCMTLVKNLSKPFIEMGRGMLHGTIPWSRCLSICLCFELLLLCRIDFWLLSKTRFLFLYPCGFFTYYFYYFLVIISPFLFWGLEEALRRERLMKSLDLALEEIGLKNNLGKTPKYVFDKPIDKCMRKLRLTRSSISARAFEQHKGDLEGSMHIFIDEFREDRTGGTIDIIYSSSEMKVPFKYPDYTNVTAPSFIVGMSRSKVIRSSLIEHPHLLIAGQSGGGKSTFTRQLITTLYLNDKAAQFTIIDLKGSVESQFFEELDRVNVPQTMEDAIYQLQCVSTSIEYRLKLLKANGCKDILEYFNVPYEKRISVSVGNSLSSNEMSRHVIVVDEAAEMFLAGEGRTTLNIQNAKSILSKIARQGRAIGIHLVIATQRPDARALDSQIKANLTGVLCFQMANDSSSILVLGNGRATDLPSIPGRAIWKMGMEMHEVQTPLLTQEVTLDLLRKAKSVKKLKIDESSSAKPTNQLSNGRHKFGEKDA